MDSPKLRRRPSSEARVTVAVRLDAEQRGRLSRLVGVLEARNPEMADSPGNQAVVLRHVIDAGIEQIEARWSGKR